jgi:hypothetical protein
MPIYKTLFFLGLLCLCACKSEVPIPADIIQPNRMAPICAEMHIVDGDLYNITQMPDSLYKYSIGHYTAILSKYHTDTVQFKKALPGTLKTRLSWIRFTTMFWLFYKPNWIR